MSDLEKALEILDTLLEREELPEELLDTFNKLHDMVSTGIDEIDELRNEISEMEDNWEDRNLSPLQRVGMSEHDFY